MAIFQQDELTLHYSDQGNGFPVLLLAPGGMRSATELWERAPFDPRQLLASDFRVIAMDQRNAGASRGPISSSDGWHTYTRDQLALLDHLGIERCHVVGMCIGGPFCLGLMQAAPERIAAGVLMQPIGHDGNRDAFYEMFDSWANELRAARPEVPAATWESFRANLYDGDFVFNLSESQVQTLQTPMLVLRGDDLYHPASTSERLVELAPQAELIRDWKTGDDRIRASERMVEFLRQHGQ